MAPSHGEQPATIADVVTAEDRPRAYGLIYWAVNLGASIAPILGGLIAARSYRALFVADAATTASLYGVIVLAAFRETRPAATRGRTVRPEPRAPFWATVSCSRSAALRSPSRLFSFNRLSRSPSTCADVGCPQWRSVR
jgi:MFS family permease